jgi:hypothetical protein
MGFCPGDSGTAYMDDELYKLIIGNEEYWTISYPLPSRDTFILLV